MAAAFFTSWVLWQQMTFVLACSIVLVFCIGLVKLWYTNRILKKHMVLDLEKQARQQEMRRSGLPVGKRIDIPFGVRAIQSGIEVDGIWISRPGTPAESEGIGATSTLIGSVSEMKGKEKALPVTGGLRSPTTAVFEVQPTPNDSPAPSLLDRNDAMYAPAPLRTSHTGPQHTYRPSNSSQRQFNTSTDTTRLGSVRQSEEMVGTPRLETYVPTSSLSTEQNSSYRPMKSRPGSFDDEDAQEYSTPSSRYQDRPVVPTAREQFSFEDLDLGAGGLQSDSYFGGPRAEPERRRNPFESGEYEGSLSRDSQTASHRANPSSESTESRMMPPKRSYSGETHVNTSSRRVNAGFEVLPAGTFSRSNSQADMETGSSRSRNRISHGGNRLQKKAHDRP